MSVLTYTTNRYLIAYDPVPKSIVMYCAIFVPWDHKLDCCLRQPRKKRVSIPTVDNSKKNRIHIDSIVIMWPNTVEIYWILFKCSCFLFLRFLCFCALYFNTGKPRVQSDIQHLSQRSQKIRQTESEEFNCFIVE